MSLCIHFVEKLVVKSLLKTKGALKEINPDLAALLFRMSSISSGAMPPLVLSTIPSLNACIKLARIRFWVSLACRPNPGAAAIVELLAHGFEVWLRLFEDVLVAADHEGESAR